MQDNLSSTVLNAILSKFGTQKAAADALGITESTFSRNLEKLSPRFIARLKNLGVNLLYMEKKSDLEIINKEFVSIPVYESVNAGNSSPVFIAEPIDHLYLPKNGLNRFGVKVHGESMSPTINEGDIIILDPDEKPLDKDICLIAIDDYQYTLKRVFFDLDIVILKPDNKDFDERKVHISQIKSILPVVNHIRNRQQLRG